MISCENSSVDASAPEISFKSLSKDTLDQGISDMDDFVFVTISFSDKDGNIDNTGSEHNAFFIDTRQNTEHARFIIPELPEGGSDGSVDGDIQFKLLTSCCINDFGETCQSSITEPLDSVRFEIYVVDGSSLESNRILTPWIYLRCN